MNSFLRSLLSISRKRKLLIISLTCLLLLLLGLFVRYLFLPSYRPGISAEQVYGLDVSNHQGVIDWQAVKQDNIDAVYIKSSEGGDWTDQRFAENWVEAKEAGLDVGAYHFFTFCTAGKKQAEHFLETVDYVNSDLPLALDLEFGGNCTNPFGEEKIVAEVQAFLDTVEAQTNEKTLLYVLEDLEFLSEIAEERPVWRRSLFRKPSNDNWLVWQLSGISKVDGVEGPVDLNVFKIS